MAGGTFDPMVKKVRPGTYINFFSENVENVVKPPHTPVFKNKSIFLENLSLKLAIPVINPIKIAPIILVINVKNGNPIFTGIRLIAYLAIDPTAPPKATNKNAIFISF